MKPEQIARRLREKSEQSWRTADMKFLLRIAASEIELLERARAAHAARLEVVRRAMQGAPTDLSAMLAAAEETGHG